MRLRISKYDGAIVSPIIQRAIFVIPTRTGATITRANTLFVSSDKVKMLVINRVVKKRLGNDYSGHSLRRGFITESFNRGATLVDIVHQTGQSPQTVQRDYLNELEKGKHNAARLF